MRHVLEDQWRPIEKQSDEQRIEKLPRDWIFSNSTVLYETTWCFFIVMKKKRNYFSNNKQMFGYIYWWNDWIRRSDWIPMFALKGLTEFTSSPPRGGRTCSALSSACGTVERKGRGNKRGNRFQGECTRHVLRYMESCDCFPDSGSTRARIHGQTFFGERRGVSTRKDPSLSIIYNAKRGLEFSFLDGRMFVSYD